MFTVHWLQEPDSTPCLAGDGIDIDDLAMAVAYAHAVCSGLMERSTTLRGFVLKDRDGRPNHAWRDDGKPVPNTIGDRPPPPRPPSPMLKAPRLEPKPERSVDVEKNVSRRSGRNAFVAMNPRFAVAASAALAIVAVSSQLPSSVSGMRAGDPVSVAPKAGFLALRPSLDAARD